MRSIVGGVLHRLGVLDHRERNDAVVAVEHLLELVEAENGLEALGVVEAHDDIRFAVVDIHMPIMNGIEFIRRFRSDHTSRFEGCHVFVITTEASRTLRAEMKELGVLAWLVKPVDPKLFIKTLQLRFGAAIDAARSEAASP